jgi:hypothetical protein
MTYRQRMNQLEETSKAAAIRTASAAKEVERRNAMSKADTFAEGYSLGYQHGRDGEPVLTECAVADSYPYSQEFRNGYYSGFEIGQGFIQDGEEWIQRTGGGQE